MLCGTFWLLTAATAVAQPPQHSLLNNVSDNFVAGVYLRPAAILSSRPVQMIAKALDQDATFEKAMQEARQQIGADPRQIEELIALWDRTTLYEMAGLPTSEEGADRQQLARQMRDIMLALHHFHDVYQQFPDHDGIKENRNNLSWRVHVLPFLGQQRLYERFRLNEPWDSEHNKALIEEMPEVYQTPGVKAAGRTTVHGIVDPQAAFNGQGGTRIQDIRDGTSYSIMLVLAGPDKADVWTKPGGLELKEGPPPATLGNVGDEFLAAFADGSVRWLPSDMDKDTFHNLVTIADSHPVKLPQLSNESRGHLPTVLLKLREEADIDAIVASLKSLGPAQTTQVDGVRAWQLKNFTVLHPEPRTVMMAPPDLIASVRKPAQSDEGFATQMLAASRDRDLSIVVNLADLTEFRDKLPGNVPMAGLIQKIERVSFSMDITGKGDALQELTARTQDVGSAVQLNALINGLLQTQKAQLTALGQNPANGIPPEVVEVLNEIQNGTSITTEGTTVRMVMKKPNDMDAVYEKLEPALLKMAESVRTARAQAARMNRQNHLKQIGLAFHNYHDVFNRFPRYNGPADWGNKKENKGLSWRVYLLPFLGHADLYQRFHLDEPWDSDHNRKLIEDMPDVFKTPGVDKPGYTSHHVFIGEKTMFGDGSRATGIRDILDGTSNTILVVEAGPDKAEPWTKPTGITLTEDGGVELLGKIEKSFLALFADGSVHVLPADIDKEVFRNLIQHQDGNPVDIPRNF